MCNLQQGEFLAARFKENMVEKDVWKSVMISTNNQTVKELAKIFSEIAEKKANIYQEHLDKDLRKDVKRGEEDPTLMELREITYKYDNCIIDHNKRWLLIDAALAKAPKDKEYKQVDGEWRVFPKNNSNKND